MQHVTHVEEGAVAEAEYFIKKLRTLGMRAELQNSGEKKRMHEWRHEIRPNYNEVREVR